MLHMFNNKYFLFWSKLFSLVLFLVVLHGKFDSTCELILLCCCYFVLKFLLSENNLPVQFLPSPEYPSLHAQV